MQCKRLAFVESEYMHKAVLRNLFSHAAHLCFLNLGGTFEINTMIQYSFVLVLMSTIVVRLAQNSKEQLEVLHQFLLGTKFA